MKIFLSYKNLIRTFENIEYNANYHQTMKCGLQKKKDRLSAFIGEYSVYIFASFAEHWFPYFHNVFPVTVEKTYFLHCGFMQCNSTKKKLKYVLYILANINVIPK